MKKHTSLSFLLAVLLLAPVGLEWPPLAGGDGTAQAAEAPDLLTNDRYSIAVTGMENPTGVIRIEGLESEFATVSYTDGADPRYERLLPGEPKFYTLTLTLRVNSASSPLRTWFTETSQGIVNRKEIAISLLKPDSTPALSYRLLDCLPQSYSVEIAESASSFLVERIELKVGRMEIDTDPAT